MRIPMTSLLLAFCLTMQAQQPSSSAEPPAKVRLDYLRAYNAQDAEAVLALYAEDAVLVSEAGTFHGRAEISTWLHSGLDQGSRLEAIEPVAEKTSGTLAYGSGRTRRLAGTELHLGQYLIVMEKLGDQWKIVQHFSVNAGVLPALERHDSPARN